MTGDPGTRMYRGEVSAMAASNDGKSALAFRMRSHDESGNPLPILHVEMSLTRKRLIGRLAPRDEVEFEGRMDRKGIVRTEKIRNRTTGIWVTTKLNKTLFMGLLFALLIIFSFGLIIFGMVSSRGGPSPLIFVGFGVFFFTGFIAMLSGIFRQMF